MKVEVFISFRKKLTLPYVHIVNQTRPIERVSEVVQFFKGNMSRVIREEFMELEEFPWRDSFWADGYCAETSRENR